MLKESNRDVVLFVTSINTHFVYLLPIAINLRDHNYKCVFVFDPYSWPSDGVEAQCVSNGFTYVTKLGKYDPTANGLLGNKRGRLLGNWIAGQHVLHVAKWIFKKIPGIPTIFRSVMSYRFANKVLCKVGPTMVFTGEDTGYIAPYFVARANVLGIATAVSPFSLTNQEEQLCSRARCSRYEVGPNQLIKRVFYKKYPKWIRNNNGKSISFYDLLTCGIMEFLKVSPQDPWNICGGNSRVAFVESDFVKNYYVKSGVAPNKIVVVGDIVPVLSDKPEIQLERRNALACKYRVNVNASWVVLAVPPDHINNETFGSFFEMVSSLIEVLIAENTVVILSLHPRTSRDSFSQFEVGGGVIVMDEPVMSLIGAGDLFVAVSSATIRFALSQKKPVINFNVYGLPYTEYSNLKMVKEVSNMKEFREVYGCFCASDSQKDAAVRLYDDFPLAYFGGGASRLAGAIAALKQNRKEFAI